MKVPKHHGLVLCLVLNFESYLQKAIYSIHYFRLYFIFVDDIKILIISYSLQFFYIYVK